MTLKKLKELLNALPEEYDNLQVEYYNAYFGCRTNITTAKLHKKSNTVILTAPKARYNTKSKKTKTKRIYKKLK